MATITSSSQYGCYVLASTLREEKEILEELESVTNAIGALSIPPHIYHFSEHQPYQHPPSFTEDSLALLASLHPSSRRARNALPLGINPPLEVSLNQGYIGLLKN